jgi:hypothetical protein
MIRRWGDRRPDGGRPADGRLPVVRLASRTSSLGPSREVVPNTRRSCSKRSRPSAATERRESNRASDDSLPAEMIVLVNERWGPVADEGNVALHRDDRPQSLTRKRRPLEGRDGGRARVAGQGAPVCRRGLSEWSAETPSCPCGPWRQGPRSAAKVAMEGRARGAARHAARHRARCASGAYFGPFSPCRAVDRFLRPSPG